MTELVAGKAYRVVIKVTDDMTMKYNWLKLVEFDLWHADPHVRVLQFKSEKDPWEEDAGWVNILIEDLISIEEVAEKPE